MATPLHFGDSARPLYGVFHAPSSRPVRRRAALLFNPFGEEAIRAFRIYRLLAERLAARGVAVMRFDYPSTGDSAGACEAASLEAFRDGAAQAHEELSHMADAQEVVWIGLRLGAAVAATLGARGPVRPSRLILWDPVVSGADYLAEILAGHGDAIRLQLGREPASGGAATEALGFALGGQLVADLKTLDLFGLGARAARRITVFAGDDPPTDQRLGDALTATGAETAWRAPLGEISWNSDAALNSFVVPARTLDLIVDEALS